MGMVGDLARPPFKSIMASGEPMSRASQVAKDATLDIGSPSAKASKYERMAFYGVLPHWNLRFCRQCHGTSRCKRCWHLRPTS